MYGGTKERHAANPKNIDGLGGQISIELPFGGCNFNWGLLTGGPKVVLAPKYQARFYMDITFFLEHSQPVYYMR